MMTCSRARDGAAAAAGTASSSRPAAPSPRSDIPFECIPLVRT